jgi:hypothetical protein
MVIDDGGAIWLSNPWLAGVVLSFAVGLVLWCHRWLETGQAPAPRNLRLRTMPMARRMAPTSATTAPAQLHPRIRTRMTRMPRTAA